MAINHSDREDLLRDGTGMPIRAEAEIDGVAITVGFRSDGQLSLYCDDDPVYQFNANGQLRRVFFEGERYAAEQAQIVWLQQKHHGGRLVFESSAVDRNTHDAILGDLARRIESLAAFHLKQSDHWKVQDRKSAFAGQLATWLSQYTHPPKIADSPAA